MFSDGNELLSVGSQNNIMISEARTNGHPYTGFISAMGASSGTLGADHVWALTEDGLMGWQNNGQFTPVDATFMRRAHPLTVRAMDNTGLNITDMTHPGTQINLIDPSDPYALDPELGVLGVHNLLFQNVPLVLTSPLSGSSRVDQIGKPSIRHSAQS